MTKTALANREIRSREDIAKKDRESRESIAQQERALKEREGKKDRIQKYVGSVLGLAGHAIPHKNDPKWYKSYLSDLEEFVRIPTYDRLGANDHRGRGTVSIDNADAYSQHNLSIPGIMVFRWVPTIGAQATMNNINGPINSALSRLKEKILALNSRSNVDWEMSDLGYNIYCSADIASLIIDLGRAIKVFNTYHSKNSYLARELLQALGWSWTDFSTHYAEYRKAYTLFARRFNSSIVAPADITLYQRRMYLAGNVFIDSEDAKYPRQMYAFKQQIALKLHPEGTECVAFNVVRTSFDTFRNQLQNMIDSITLNPDFIAMYQDLRHAVGDKILQLPESVTGEEVVFNTDVLNRMQIHNLRTLPRVWGKGPQESPETTPWNLRQNSDGSLLQGASGVGRRVVFNISGTRVKEDFKILMRKYYGGLLTVGDVSSNEYGADIYNSTHENVTGDDILDITRFNFMARLESETSDTLTYIITDCGTEVALDFKIFYTSRADTPGSILTGSATDYMGTFEFCTEFQIAQNEQILMMYSFDWAPIMHYTIVDESDSELCQSVALVDGHTTFIIDNESLSRINEACVLGLIYLPDVGFAH